MSISCFSQLRETGGLFKSYIRNETTNVVWKELLQKDSCIYQLDFDDSYYVKVDSCQLLNAGVDPVRLYYNSQNHLLFKNQGWVKKSKDYIYSLNAACCCQKYSYCQINSLVDDFEVVIQFHPKTKFIFSDSFYTKIVIGQLRQQPVIDDVEFVEECTGMMHRGNVITNINNREVLVLANYGKWLLVLYKSKHIYYVGWLR